jgi:hypothetical protein
MWCKALEFEDTFRVSEQEIFAGTELDENSIPAELPERAMTSGQQFEKLISGEFASPLAKRASEQEVEDFFDSGETEKAEVHHDLAKRSSTRGMIRCERKTMPDGLEWEFRYDHEGRQIRAYPLIAA